MDTTVKRIIKLDQVVVNRIAAGEIIQRPSNAIKELLENSIDAGSTLITIQVKEGGLKLLSICDNGHGIHKADLEIVCERFTTSKLKKYEDLLKIDTFGFRGEALSSISHVAHVTIKTKTSNEACAYIAHYSDGKLVSPKQGQSSAPKPCAGNIGTTLTVEDLFYNTPQRLKALKPTEEYTLILKVLQKYAVHYPHISFILKKVGQSTPDLATQSGTTQDALTSIFMTKNLVGVSEIVKEYECVIEGFISTTQTFKSQQFLLFINNRLVESNLLKKGIDGVYSRYLMKGEKGFVYLSLKIKSEWVDVNIHPTKRQVRFLNEDKITESVCALIELQLEHSGTSKEFMVQTLLKPMVESSQVKVKENVYPSGKVRNDFRTRTLDSYLTQTVTDTPTSNQKRKHVIELNENVLEMVQVKLTSIIQLRQVVCLEVHQGIVDMLREHVFVGVANERKSLLQYRTKLYLIDYREYGRALFYQYGLRGFSNYGLIELTHPIDISECVLLSIRHEKSHMTTDEMTLLSMNVKKLIVGKKDLLEEYFRVKMNDKFEIVGLPMVMSGVSPHPGLIPKLLLDLYYTNWTDEMLCFKGIIECFAGFYADGIEGDAIERVLFKAFRNDLIPTKSLEQHTTQVADIPDLYKVFERC